MSVCHNHDWSEAEMIAKINCFREEMTHLVCQNHILLGQVNILPRKFIDFWMTERPDYGLKAEL